MKNSEVLLIELTGGDAVVSDVPVTVEIVAAPNAKLDTRSERRKGIKRERRHVVSRDERRKREKKRAMFELARRQRRL